MKKLLLGVTVVTAVAVVSSFLLLTQRRQSKPSERLRDRIYLSTSSYVSEEDFLCAQNWKNEKRHVIMKGSIIFRGDL
ncbi:hypothetical protein ACVNSY_11660 [Bacillus sp. OHL2]